MRDIRIYCDAALAINTEVELDNAATHHVHTVLRMQVGDMIVLFNGNGVDYIGTLASASKQAIRIHLHDTNERVTQSPLHTHLVQGICKGDKMDFVIQKATELGINEITPLYTQYGNVRFDHKRCAKKIEHWQKIAINACQQSGRNDLVQINMPLAFVEWINAAPENTVIFDPGATKTLRQLPIVDKLAIMVGPEGGFSTDEIALATQNHVQNLLLGPRVLRSETAGLAALALAQSLWGDL